MPKGKKFNAAEMHFSKKEAVLKKQLAEALRDKQIYYQKFKDQEEIIRSLSAEVLSLRDWVERLLEYTELDVKDIKAVCAGDKKMAALLGLFETINPAVTHMFSFISKKAANDQ